MDSVAALAGQVVAILAPFLPQLIVAGQQLTARVGAEMEERSGEIAQALWKQLGSKLGERPAASEAVHDAAANPDDADAQAALRVQLSKLLAEDTDLVGQLTRILVWPTRSLNRPIKVRGRPRRRR